MYKIALSRKLREIFWKESLELFLRGKHSFFCYLICKSDLNSFCLISFLNIKLSTITLAYTIVCWNSVYCACFCWYFFKKHNSYSIVVPWCQTIGTCTKSFHRSNKIPLKYMYYIRIGNYIFFPIFAQIRQSITELVSLLL